jgi:hypothetical protein
VTALALLGSVVIPRTTRAPFRPGELYVVVAYNGCTDGGADIARSSGHPVRVTEVEAASKPTALRAAEGAITAFPRLHVNGEAILIAASPRGSLSVAVLARARRPAADQIRHQALNAARP